MSKEAEWILSIGCFVLGLINIPFIIQDSGVVYWFLLGLCWGTPIGMFLHRAK